MYNLRAKLQRRQPERGVTLLELVIAATLVFASILATVGVVDSSSRAAAAASTRRTATEVAFSELTKLEVMAYPELGLDPQLGEFDEVVDGRRTVSIAANRVAAQSTSTDGGRRFDVDRSVTWSSGDRQEVGVFKFIRVRVSWGGPHRGSVELTGASGPADAPVSCEREWVDGAVSVMSGTVNTYLAVAAPSGEGATVLEVVPPLGESVRSGDSLLVMQMTGPSAGRFEYAIAGSSHQSGRLVVAGAGPGGGLVHAYGVGGAAQVVRVPTVGDAAISSDVVATAWNGSTGGVVALDVTGSITGPGAIRADGAGLDSVATASDRPDLLRLGGGSGGRGGGVVAVRGTSDGVVAVDVSAGGAPGTGASGGSILITSLRPTGSAIASGASSGSVAGGTGGLIVTSIPANSMSVAGGRGRPDGRDGRVVTGWASNEVDGLPAGAGCLPAIEVTKTAAMERVQTTAGSIAVWTVRVSNAAGRGTATGVEITDTFAEDVRFAATLSVSSSGGARRTAVRDPAAGTAAPRWGTFEIPAGGAVEIVVAGNVRSGAFGVIGNGATATFDSSLGVLVAGLPLDELGADRVQLTPFSCQDASTDVEFLGNTYFPLTSDSEPGAQELRVGPPTAGPALEVGDEVLVMQMEGPSAGAWEYALVRDLAPGLIRVEGRGPSAGLINGYGSDGASQVVRVPTVPALVVDREFTAPRWDGSVGGVLAIDVVGPLLFDGGALDVDGLGRSGAAAGAGGSASAGRLPTGSGAGADSGGGVIAVRAALVGGSGRLTADAAGGGGGGAAALATLGGDLSGLDFSANGVDGAGAVLVSGMPRSAEAEGGSPVVIRTDLDPADLPGMPLGSTCAPDGTDP
ncbi:MAG: hypothetical protein R2696_10835 [Microthrixaceae bacterium]